MSDQFKHVIQIIVVFILIITSSCTRGKNHHALKDAVINGDFEIAGEKLTGWNLEARHADK